MLALNAVVDGGRFHVLDMLGKGGSGVAYLGFDLKSSTPEKGKYYAIKCLFRSNNQSAIMREVQLHKFLSRHENIVTLRRCVPEGRYQILIMDYCPDGDLFRLITQKRGWPFTSVASCGLLIMPPLYPSDRYIGNDTLIRDV